MKQTEILKQICRTGLSCPHKYHFPSAIIISALPGPGFCNSHCASMLNDYQNGWVLWDVIAIKAFAKGEIKTLWRGNSCRQIKAVTYTDPCSQAWVG